MQTLATDNKKEGKEGKAVVSLNIAHNISDLDTVKREKTARDFTANDQTQEQLRH